MGLINRFFRDQERAAALSRGGPGALAQGAVPPARAPVPGAATVGAGARPAAAAPGSPAPRAAGRPPELVGGRPGGAPVPISVGSQIPGYHPETTVVLTAPSGKFEIPALDMRTLIALEIDGRVLVVSTGRSEDAPALSRLLTRLRRELITPGGEFVATPDVIATLYEPAMGALGRTDSVGRARIDEIIDGVCGEAWLQRASDIHIYVTPKSKTEIWFRVDGRMRLIRTESGQFGADFVNGLHTRGDVDTKAVAFDPRVPQGMTISRRLRIKDRVDPVDLRLRYQSQPVYPEGYDVVLRVINVGATTQEGEVSSLGFVAPQVRAITAASHAKYGMTVLIGATGSGKSTTILNVVNDLAETFQDQKIIAVEDPPEYRLRARQAPIVIPDGPADTERTRRRMAFQRALTAAMRQDPDSIVVGEIRDEATAELAMQAALTGHRVITTYHANSPVHALQRFREMNVPLDVLGSEGFMRGIISQTLLPVLCPKCSQPWASAQMPVSIKPAAWTQMRRLLEAHVDVSHVRVRGKGCEHCGGRGTRGRTVVAEVFVPNYAMLELITRGDWNGVNNYWHCARLLEPSLAEVGAGLTMLDHAVFHIQAGKVCPFDVMEAGIGQFGAAMPLKDRLESLQRSGVISSAELHTALDRWEQAKFWPGTGPGSAGSAA